MVETSRVILPCWIITGVTTSQDLRRLPISGQVFLDFTRYDLTFPLDSQVVDLTSAKKIGIIERLSALNAKPQYDTSR